MSEIIEYSLSDEIKKQLGFIIREMRKHKFQEFKELYLIEKNPYTKENFCDNNTTCHYHTLTKLENDLVKEDYLYHVLLEKLGLYYQTSENNHIRNMEKINSITSELIKAIEYIDDNLFDKIKNELDKIDFKKDCIALFHLKVIQLAYNLQKINKIEKDVIDLLEKFIDFYEGLYKGLVLQCLGIYYLNLTESEKAKTYFLAAKEVYINYNISKGLINSYLISVYKMAFNYLVVVTLSNEMEEYYLKTNNYKRLMHVYNYLSDYYLLINANDLAEQYFKKAIEIIDNNSGLERFKFTLYYNWGVRLFKEYRNEDSLTYFLKSYENINNDVYYLNVINMILIIITKLQYDQTKIDYYYSLGEKYYELSTEFEQTIFKYFRYKMQSKKYHRRHALEKIIPNLQNNRNRKEMLLFFYEDLYK